VHTLLSLALLGGVACTVVNPVDDYGGTDGRDSTPTGATTGTGTTGASAEDAGSATSTPSPVWHKDAGAWEPDAHVPAAPVAPPSIPVGDDASIPILPVAPPVSDDSGAPSSTEDAGSSLAAAVAACAGGINALRGQNDLFPYTISPSLETFAAQAAASDALSGQQDGFINGNGGEGVSFAEHEFDGDRIDPGASAYHVFEQGLLDEEEGEINGEGNLLSQQFSQVGCGVAQASDGSYWVAIEYQ
jgi:hypothetical protein